MPHGQQEACAEKRVRLAIADALVDQLGSIDHHEQRVAVALGLGPLVRLERIFDGQIVQAELVLQLVQHRFLRLVQANPDKAIRALQHVADLLQADVVAFGIAIVIGAGDDAGRVVRMAAVMVHGRILDQRVRMDKSRRRKAIASAAWIGNSSNTHCRLSCAWNDNQ